jgi:hypothetical protein
MTRPTTRLHLEMQPQPDDFTCGPTCLQAVYRYFGDDIPLQRVIDEARTIEPSGTIAVMLGLHALRRGYSATIYTYNLHMFDPTWFELEPELLPRKLRLQAEAKKDDQRLRLATDAYIEFLRLGGWLNFEDLTSRLLRRHLSAGRPILTGLSATYLYRCAREYGPNDDYDDVRGQPSGHFVVLCGYDKLNRKVTIADPLADNPASMPHLYDVPMARIVNAILLGILTHDANLLVIEPPATGVEDVGAEASS